MEEATTPGTLVNFYQTTWCSILKDSHMQKYDCVEGIKNQYVEQMTIVKGAREGGHTKPRSHTEENSLWKEREERFCNRTSHLG
jgi:hypothetical protein